MATEELPAASVSKWTGLYRSVDPFAIAPGAMSRADNVVVPGPSLLRPRRGFAGAPIAFGNTRINALGSYGDNIVYTTPAFPSGYVASSLTAAAAVTRGASDFAFSPATLLSYGPVLPALATRTRFFGANANLYATTNFGLGRTDVPEFPTFASWAPAGMDTPIMGFYSLIAGTLLPNKGAVGYPNGSEVAYCVTYRWTDANGNEHRSAPSTKTLVQNLSTTQTSDVNVSAVFTPMVMPGAIAEFWRTSTIAIPINGADATGSEFFKVAETPVVGNVGANGYLAFNGSPWAQITDKTPDAPFLVEPLYTNPTTGAVNGLGIANANTPPPACADVFTFKGRTYYLNTQEIERLTTQIIGTGTGGIVDGDTFFVDGVGFQWKDSGSPAAGFFSVQLWRTGGPADAGSPVENLRMSSVAACSSINVGCGLYGGFFAGSPLNSLSQKIRAQPTALGGMPGYVAMERLVPGAAAFTITPGVGSGRGWAGSLVTNNTSDPNRQPANLMQSHADDPESVPPAFTRTVGRLDRQILRGIGLRDAAYIFKQGDGLWKFTDDGTGELVIGPVDQTVDLVASETAVALDNAIFCLSDKGVLRITDGGAPEIVSNDKIQDELNRLAEYVGPSTLANVAFAIGYESDRLYVLALPETPNATTCTVQYIYNLDTGAWSRWTLPNLSAGVVAPSLDRLVLGRDSTGDSRNPIWVERKTLTDDDQQDPGFTAQVPGVGTYSASALTFSGDLTKSYAPGDLVRYVSGPTATLARVVSAVWNVGADQTTVTFDRSVAWTAGLSFSVLPAIQCRLELLPLVNGEPLYEKQWQDVYLFFRRATFTKLDTSFSTEKQQTPVVYPLAGPTQTPWLYDETLGFGLTPWGGKGHNVILHQPLDQAAARSAELTLGLRIGDALASWELSALRVPYQPTTRKVAS